MNEPLPCLRRTELRRVHDADKAQLAEARGHLVAVLQGKMGSTSK